VLADAVSPAGREVVALPADAGRVTALTFDDRGDRLAIATSEGGVAVFDVDAGFRAVPVHVGAQISSLALTGTDELWVADRDGVRSYGSADGRERRAVTDARLRGGVVIVADPSERRLAVGTANGVLFVDLDDLSVSSPILGDQEPVSSVAYSPDGSMFAAALAKGAVALWDGGTLEQLRAPLSLARANALAFSPDGSALAALGRGGDAVIIATALEEWRRSACDIAGRRLTRAEWKRFLPGMSYDPAC
jgi:WD40 repeat protein